MSYVRSTSVKKYTFTLIALFVLFAATLILAYIDLGPFNLVVGLFIATAKAALVLTYFMHLRDSSGIHRVAASAGVFWLGILVFLTLSDYLSRNWLPLPGAWP